MYRPEKPGEVLTLEDTLESKQELVEGYIEVVSLGDGIILTLNEDGKNKNLPFNFDMPGDPIVGTAFFARTRGDDYESLTDRDIERIRRKVGR